VRLWAEPNKEHELAIEKEEKMGSKLNYTL
jgi:hypothetical protein